MKEKQETQPAKVTAPGGTKQAGDIRDRWWWVEHGVWTKPMLGRLETSGSRTNWFGLWDKVISPGNLQASWNAVWRNHGAPGMDRQTISQFEKHVEQDFAQHSYGFRPGRGAKQAIQRVDELMEGGRAYVIDADLKSYFDTIPHDRLMKLVRHRITDGQVTRLIEQYLKAGVMEQGRDWEVGEEGTPQARAILEELQRWTEEAGLKLHEQKTRIVDAREEPFDFLGWTLSLKPGRSRKWPRRKSRSKLREQWRITNDGPTLVCRAGAL